jgi:hypothetical protein
MVQTAKVFQFSHGCAGSTRGFQQSFQQQLRISRTLRAGHRPNGRGNNEPGAARSSEERA